MASLSLSTVVIFGFTGLWAVGYYRGANAYVQGDRRRGGLWLLAAYTCLALAFSGGWLL